MINKFLKLPKDERKLLFGSLVFLTFSLGALSIRTCNKEEYFLPQEIINSPKIEYFNSKGEIWHAYMKEKIPHNTQNWKLYQEEVKKLNPQGFQGKIKLPDLDKNGIVGNQN